MFIVIALKSLYFVYNLISINERDILHTYQKSAVISKTYKFIHIHKQFFINDRAKKHFFNNYSFVVHVHTFIVATVTRSNSFGQVAIIGEHPTLGCEVLTLI